MKIRAICSDIDGTLLNKDRELSQKTIDIIRSLPHDLPVILASSRMPSAMTHLQAELGIEGHPLIAYNGGYVLRMNKKETEVLCSIEIPLGIVQRILSLSAGSSIHNSLYREDQWFAPERDQWAVREERITKVSPTLRENYAVLHDWGKHSFGAHKVMCMGAEGEIQELERQLNHELAGEIHIYRSRPTYLELAPRSISKATGLALILARYYDFPIENVMCFGDNYNDIDMLSKAGLGIAVANAREEVKAVAKEITAESVNDGVAASIEKYCFPREN